MVTAQWNFLDRFFSSIPPNFVGFISKFQIFFWKLALFRVRDMEIFQDQYSSIVPNLNYLRVTTAQWTFLHNFLYLILILRNVFRFISKFKIRLSLNFSVLGTWNIFTFSIEPTFNCLWSAKAQYIFFTRLSLTNTSQFFWFISILKIFFDKLALFHVRDFEHCSICIVPLYRLLTIFEWLQLKLPLSNTWLCF